MKFYLILSCLCACQLVYAQSPLPDFGSYSQDEIDLKECSFDKNADAVILLDEASSDFDENYRLITHRRVRIKILHQRETDRGNISIRFYSKNKFEYISRINAMSYTIENGQPVISSISNKSIFTEKEDNVYSSVKFAIPNVKEGSIIEYEYTSFMEHYGGLSSWKFQHDIPTVKSCYLLAIIPGREFQYSVQKKPSYPVVIKPMPEKGRIYFEMNNIPGLKFEPYMDAVNDYLQKVEFQLAEYINRFGDRTKVTQTWKDLAFDLLGEKEFGGAIKKNLSKTDEVRELVAAETTDSAKIAVIYNYVRNNFEWDGYYSVFASDGLKNVWEKRTGNGGEINLLLINLLQAAGMEVFPLLVAERNYGKIDVNYPFIDRFNKVVAYVKAGDQIFILDATQKFTPPGITPFPLLNTIAFVVDKKEHKLVKILSARHTYNNTIIINAKLDNNGFLKGTGQINSRGYAKQLRTEKIKTDRKNFIKDVLADPGSDLIIDNCTFDNLEDDSQPLIQKLEFHHEYDLSGGFAFLSYNMFTGFVKNPFTSEERFTNINFGYPYKIDLKIKIQLPEKSEVDKLPENKFVSSADKSTIVSRNLTLENNTLTVAVTFTQNTTLVESTKYDDIKSLYKQIIDLLNEQVVIKIGAATARN